MDFRLPSLSPELPKLWLTHNLIVLGVSLRLSVFFFSRWHRCPTRGPPQSLVYCTAHKVQTTRTWWITQSPLRAPAAALTESLGTFTREMRKHFSFLVLPSRRLKKNETPGHQNFPGHLTGPGRKPSAHFAHSVRTLALSRHAMLSAAGSHPPLQPHCPLPASLVVWHCSWRNSCLLLPIPSPCLSVLMSWLRPSLLLGTSP